MSKLLELKDLFIQEGRDQTLGLFDKFVVIKEKLNGTGISFIRESGKFKFFKTASGKNLTELDRTIHSIYENTIHHIQSLPEDIKKSLDNYRFNLRYFPSNYENRPKNGLILEDVRTLDKNGKILKFVDDPKVLDYLAHLLEIERSPVCYHGRLNKKQKNIIVEGIDKPEKLYENMKTLFGYFKDMSDGYTIKFLDKLNEDISLKVLNPKSDIKIKRKSRTPSDTYALALQDILEFVQTINLDNFAIKGETKVQRVLNLLSDIYSKYIQKNGSKYQDMTDLDGPDFAKNIPEFDVNLKFVVNKNTIKYLEKSQINQELFKLFLGTFTKKKKNTSVLIDDNMRFEINKLVDMISDRAIETPENKETVPTFEDYFYNKYQKRALLESDYFLKEAILLENVSKDLVQKEPGKTPVNIIVGRFQPPTLGHIKLLRKLNAENSLPCVIVQVRSKSKGNLKFDESLITKIWMDIIKQYSFIVSVEEAQTGFLVPVLDALRSKYEPVLWGTGTDRYKDYVRMIKNYGPECNVLDDFRPFEVKRDSKNISATQVRDAIEADDEKLFKKLTPKAEHRYYKQLRTELLQS